MPAKNTGYSNFFLSNEIEDQLNSHLDLQQFCTIDRSLVGAAGDTKKINVYKATEGAEKVDIGVGNSKSITVSSETNDYKIICVQSRFDYYDEEEANDPLIVQTGVRRLAADIFNTQNADIYAEFNKATLTLEAAAFNFDAVVDAAALMKIENLEGVRAFGFVSPLDTAKFRKALKDTLQYVEAYARNGYLGTVGGVDLYTKKDATEGEVIIGTKEAVTLFLKSGVEVEQSVKNMRSSEDANVRLNSIFARKYYVPALTNATRAVKVTVAG